MDLSEDINIAELFDLTDDLPNVDLIEGNDEVYISYDNSSENVINVFL